MTVVLFMYFQKYVLSTLYLKDKSWRNYFISTAFTSGLFILYGAPRKRSTFPKNVLGQFRFRQVITSLRKRKRWQQLKTNLSNTKGKFFSKCLCFGKSSGSGSTLQVSIQSMFMNILTIQGHRFYTVKNYAKKSAA